MPDKSKLVGALNLARGVASRIGLGHKDVTERVPQLTSAAQKLRDGTLTREEYEALVNTYKPVEPYSSAPMPTTREEALAALKEPQRSKYGATADIAAGTPVGLRLDIPAYSNHGAWIASVHADPGNTFRAGDVMGYGPTAAARNARLGVVENAALNIAGGKPKGTIATIKGEWNPMSDDEALARMMQALEEPQRWRQIGMDPERHSYFYDRATMEPVVRAEEVIQVGPLVVGRDVTYGSKKDFKYSSGGSVGE